MKELENIEIESVNFVSKDGRRGLSIIEAAIYANKNQCNVRLFTCGSSYHIKEDDISNMINKIKER